MIHAGPTHPHHGGRIVLERLQSGEPEDALLIRYALTLFTREASWTTRIVLAARGDWELRYDEPWQLLQGATSDGQDVSQPPAWLLATAEAFLRSLWKARQGEDAPPWPRRLSRWRESRIT